MELTLRKLCDIDRLLGVIEGAASGAPLNVANTICDAVYAIDKLLKEDAD